MQEFMVNQESSIQPPFDLHRNRMDIDTTNIGWARDLGFGNTPSIPTNRMQSCGISSKKTKWDFM
tara:strand:+ start:328 stop:522 length:195 start_codon:yes stop_codon:yes gene_type:complete